MAGKARGRGQVRRAPEKAQALSKAEALLSRPPGDSFSSRHRLDEACQTAAALPGSAAAAGCAQSSVPQRKQPECRSPVRGTLIRLLAAEEDRPPLSRRRWCSSVWQTRSQAQGSSVRSQSSSAARSGAGRKWESRPSAPSAISSQSAPALWYNGASLLRQATALRAQASAGPQASPLPASPGHVLRPPRSPAPPASHLSSAERW